jgi:hypothetical protein
LNPVKRGRGWARKYPPLALVVVALALAILALPSALNLPQANPGQTLEYAPVPGENGASTGGNFAGLGLGAGGEATGSVGSGGTSGDGPPPLDQQQQLSGTSGRPSQYRCVGNPPRQTEDPLSPPCVAFFNGDNGGATWAGVTPTEIPIVFRFLEGGGQCRSEVVAANSCQPSTSVGIFDMDKPSDYNQYFIWTDLHNWETYFNLHYQTYKRRVHFYVDNYGDTASEASGHPTASDVRGEAAQAYSQVHPFADWDDLDFFSDSYTQYMAQHRAVSFGALQQKLASTYPGQFWSYLPPLEAAASKYADWACTRVVKPGTVTFSGNPDHGSKRVYGVLVTDDPAATQIQQVQRAAVKDMQEMCGMHPTDIKAFHYCCNFTESGPNSGWGTTNMAQFKREGITTILWPGGNEDEDMAAADRLRYYPEWVLLGDGQLDGNLMSGHASSEMQHAWVTSPIPRLNASGGQPVEQACLDALLEVNPQISRSGADIAFACGGPYSSTLYDDIRQVFTGIQLAGPRLTPAAMDQGFHAIPPKPSPGPTQPSCFYNPGDYTCVKDSVAEWFDTTTADPSTDSSGCWRMWRGGLRFLAGGWPAGDVNDRTPGDVCNHLAGGLNTTVRTPGG